MGSTSVRTSNLCSPRNSWASPRVISSQGSISPDTPASPLSSASSRSSPPQAATRSARPAVPASGNANHRHRMALSLGTAVSLKVAGSRLQIFDIAGVEQRPLAGDAASPPRWRQLVAARLVLQVPIADQGLQGTFQDCRKVGFTDQGSKRGKQGSLL